MNTIKTVVYTGINGKQQQIDAALLGAAVGQIWEVKNKIRDPQAQQIWDILHAVTAALVYGEVKTSSRVPRQAEREG